jgi:hypothetical protein
LFFLLKERERVVLSLSSVVLTRSAGEVVMMVVIVMW